MKWCEAIDWMLTTGEYFIHPPGKGKNPKYAYNGVPDLILYGKNSRFLIEISDTFGTGTVAPPSNTGFNSRSKFSANSQLIIHPGEIYITIICELLIKTDPKDIHYDYLRMAKEAYENNPH